MSREMLFQSNDNSQNVMTTLFQHSREQPIFQDSFPSKAKTWAQTSSMLLFKSHESSQKASCSSKVKRKIKTTVLQKSGHQSKSQDCCFSKNKTVTKNLKVLLFKCQGNCQKVKTVALEKSSQQTKIQDNCCPNVKTAAKLLKQLLFKVKTVAKFQECYS